MTRVSLGIIGAGVIGRRHALTIHQSDCARLVAVASKDPSGEAVAREYNVPFYASAESMFDDRVPDGVIVSTPTEVHAEPAITALEAGADVLVEKPIAGSAEDAVAICKTVESTGRGLLVGHQRRYYRCVEIARDIVASGQIGQLVAVHGQWTARKHDSYYRPPYRTRREASPLLTNLIHDIDLLRYICGSIEAVSAETSNNVLNVEKEDAAAIVLRFKSGAIGTFILSDRTPSPWGWEFATGENFSYPSSGQNCFRFMGTEGALDFPILRVWRHNPPPGNWCMPLDSQDTVCTFSDPYHRQLRHFADMIRTGAAPRVGGRDATETLRSVLAVVESATTGMRVRL